MADTTIEIENNEPLMPTQWDSFDKALQTLPKGHSSEYVTAKALDLASLKDGAGANVDSKELYDESFAVLDGAFVEEVMDANLKQYSDQITGDIQDFIDDDLTKNPENAEHHVETMVGLQATDQLYSGVLGMQEALADLFYDENFADRTQREWEASAYAGSLLEKSAEDRNLLQNISDGIGLVFDPASFTFDIDDLVEIDPSAEGATRQIQLSNIISGYQVLDPEAKKVVLPAMIDKAWEAFGDNEYKVSAFVGMLHDRDFNTDIAINTALDVVEVGTLVAAPLTMAFRAARAVKKLATVRSKWKAAGNKDQAVKATREQTSQHKDAMDADPMEWEDTMLGADRADDGLASAFQKEADRINEEVLGPLREAQKEGAFIKLDALTPDEKNLYIQSKLDAINKSTDGKVLQSAKVVSQNDNGFKISYTVGDEGTESVNRFMEVDWVQDAAGSYVGVDQQLSKSVAAAYGDKLLSPEVVLRSLDENLVGDVTFAGLQSAKLRNALAAGWKAAEKPLMDIPVTSFKKGKVGLDRRGARQAVDELLIAGDEAGQVWSMQELRSGAIQTLSGKRAYSDPEIKAYFAKRAFLDESHALQNHIVKKKLTFLGYKETSWVDNVTGKEIKDVAKPLKDGRGLPSEDIDIIAPMHNGSVDGIIKRSSLTPQDLASGDFTLVKFMTPRKVNGKKVNYGYMPNQGTKGSINNLPSKVLHKVPGYVPRISKPGYVYVKNTNDGSTLARFKTMDNAKKWAADQQGRMNANLTSDQEAVNLFPFRDRDFNAIDSVIGDSNTYGGLYTGARSKEGLFAGDDLMGEVTRLSAGQSVNRMLDNIAFQMPLNEYRLAMMTRWRDTTKQILRNNNVPDDAVVFRQLDSETEWHTADLSAIDDRSTRNMLEAHKNYMIDSLKVAHNDERKFSTLMLDVADSIPNGKARDLVVSVASKNPLQSLKGATFDAYLGWFNPRQLFVQAQNAALASSMYPAQAITAIPESFIQRLFLYSKTTDKALLAKAAKGVVDDPKMLDDMMQSIEQFKSSGLRDGVMRTGDYSSNVGGFSTGTMDTMRAASAKGRMFFEEGESMARLISWNIARKNFQKANPGTPIDDKAIRTITDDTLRMNMNMQRENAAWWQKNTLTSIPTQFLQVQAKLVENTVGGLLGNGKWTRSEASAVLAGQLFLYGTVGVPAAEGISSYFKEQVSGSGLDFAVENPKWTQQIDRGLTGVFFNSLGVENNMSESGSIIAGLDDNIVVDTLLAFNDIVRGNANEVAFKAPSIGIVARGADALGSLYQGSVDMVVAPSIETLGDSVINSIDSFAAITSTWSNSRKAIWLHKFGEIRSKDGTIVASAEQTEGMNLQTVMARAWGFPTDIEDAFYKQNEENYTRLKQRQDTTKAMSKIWDQFRLNGNLERFQGNFSLLMSEYEDMPGMQQDIMKGALRQLTNARSKIDRSNKRFLTDYIKSGGKLKPESYQAPLLPSTEENGE